MGIYFQGVSVELLHDWDFQAIGAGAPPVLADGVVAIDGVDWTIGGTANAADWEINADGWMYTKDGNAASAGQFLIQDIAADYDPFGDIIWMASQWNCPVDLNSTNGSRFMIGEGTGQIVPVFAGTRYDIFGNQYDGGQMNIRALADDVNGGAGEANLVAGSGTVTHLGFFLTGRQGYYEYGSPAAFPTRPGSTGMTRVQRANTGGLLPSQAEVLTAASTNLYMEFAAFGGGAAWTGYLERLAVYRIRNSAVWYPGS
jgi:hypothetical protein